MYLFKETVIKCIEMFETQKDLSFQDPIKTQFNIYKFYYAWQYALVYLKLNGKHFPDGIVQNRLQRLRYYFEEKKYDECYKMINLDYKMIGLYTDATKSIYALHTQINDDKIIPKEDYFFGVSVEDF